jgi:LacI family transcriptional regulator
VHHVCRALDFEATVLNSPHSIDGARAVAAGLLGRRPRCTAVFGLSDSIACGVYAAAAERGLRIPRDLSVAGYDDHPIARVLAPALTTVSWDSTDVAAAAARLLAAAVDGWPRSRSTIRVVPRLVERASTLARPARRRTAGAA